MKSGDNYTVRQITDPRHARRGSMRPGDSYTARQTQIIRDSVAFLLANLRKANDTLGTDYRRREIETLPLPSTWGPDEEAEP